MAPNRSQQPRYGTRSTSLASNPFSPAQHTALPAKKSDKRQIKHSLLLSRLKDSSKPNSAGRVQKASQRARGGGRRRGVRAGRGARRTFRNLGAELAAALPDLEGDALEDTATVRAAEAQRVTGSSRRRGGAGMRGLKHKPGHQRRIKELHDLEVARFGKNLAVMHAEPSVSAADPGDTAETNEDANASDVAMGGGAQTPAQADRWEALRKHIAESQSGLG